MPRFVPFILLIVVYHTSSAQCYRAYSVFSPATCIYQNVKGPGGEVINQRDSTGLYEGLFVYCCKNTCTFGKNESYTMGYYHHGLPIGTWIEHCEDGSFSTGEYEGSYWAGDKYKRLLLRQGISYKTGVWKFYDADSNLTRTLKFQVHFSLFEVRDMTYEMNDSGQFVLIELNRETEDAGPFTCEVEKLYSMNGTLTDKSLENIFRYIEIEYYSNGKIKSKTKCRKFLRRRIKQWSISKTYSEDGKRIDKMKSKCWHSSITPWF